MIRPRDAPMQGHLVHTVSEFAAMYSNCTHRRGRMVGACWVAVASVAATLSLCLLATPHLVPHAEHIRLYGLGPSASDQRHALGDLPPGDAGLGALSATAGHPTTSRVPSVGPSTRPAPRLARHKAPRRALIGDASEKRAGIERTRRRCSRLDDWNDVCMWVRQSWASAELLGSALPPLPCPYLARCLQRRELTCSSCCPCSIPCARLLSMPPPPSYEDVCFDGQTLYFIEGEPKDDAKDGFWAGESESDHT